MAVIEDGNNSGRKLFIDTENAAKVSLTSNAVTAGFVRLLDSDGREIITTENGALSVSTDVPLFFDQVDGNAVDTNKWVQSSSGMTIAQASGFLTLNSANAVTANAYAIVSSSKYIPLYGHLPCRASFNLKVATLPQSNMVMEFGLGLVATNAAPTDGAFFRWTAAGTFQAVTNNGGSESGSTEVLTGEFTELTGATVTLPPTTAEAEIFDIVIVEDQVQFFVGDVLVAEVEAPAGLAYPTNNGRLPVFARVYNGGSAPSIAPQLSIGQVIVVQEGAQFDRPWAETLAILGRGAYQSPVTAFGQTSNHTNSFAPSSITLSNTTPGVTALEGWFQFGAVAGAATDYCIVAYQVPTGYQLIVHSVSIFLLNTGAIGSITTPTLFRWSLGANASAASLATADGAGTWAPRRIPLGLQSFGLSAFIGSQPPDIVRDLRPGVAIDSGRYMSLILQCPVGAATASQVFYGGFLVNGYYE